MAAGGAVLAAACAAMGTYALTFCFISGAGPAVGTADTLYALLLLFIDIGRCQPDDQAHNSNDDKIIHNSAP